jgi:transposase
MKGESINVVVVATLKGHSKQKISDDTGLLLETVRTYQGIARLNGMLPPRTYLDRKSEDYRAILKLAKEGHRAPAIAERLNLDRAKVSKTMWKIRKDGFEVGYPVRAKQRRSQKDGRPTDYTQPHLKSTQIVQMANNGKSTHEIVDAMGCKPSTVWSVISHARKAGEVINLKRSKTGKSRRLTEPVKAAPHSTGGFFGNGTTTFLISSKRSSKCLARRLISAASTLQPTSEISRT